MLHEREETEGYLGTTPPDQPNTFLPRRQAPGLLRCKDRCPVGPAGCALATSGRHSVRSAVGHLENGTFWSVLLRAPGWEREAGPGSTLGGFCPFKDGGHFRNSAGPLLGAGSQALPGKGSRGDFAVRDSQQGYSLQSSCFSPK